MEEWETNIALGVAMGVVFILAIVAADIGLIWLAAQQTGPSLGTYAIGLGVLASLGLVALIGYWVYGLVDSGYFLDRNALVIHWGPMEQIVPVGQIERIVQGQEIEDRASVTGGVWPGHCVGFAEVPDVGPSLMYATASSQRQIYVVTPGLAYGISPADPEGFVQSLSKRIEMGPTQVVEQSSKRPGFLDWAIWGDRAGLAFIVVGLISVLLLTGVVCLVFPALPRLVPLHFGAAGQPDRYAPPRFLFVIPLIGLTALVVNGAVGWLLNSRERLASHLAWGGAVLVQALTWVAALGILTSV
jgi:hypothetical protein